MQPINKACTMTNYGQSMRSYEIFNNKHIINYFLGRKIYSTNIDNFFITVSFFEVISSIIVSIFVFLQ